MAQPKEDEGLGRVSLVLAFGTLVGALAIGLLWRSWPQESRDRRGSVVVTSAPMTASSTPLPPAPLARGAIPPADVEQQIRQAFPMAATVTLSCDALRCDLAVTPRVPATERDRLLIQQMFGGAIEAFVAGLGYKSAAPAWFEEVGGDEEMMRMTLRPSDKP